MEPLWTVEVREAGRKDIALSSPETKQDLLVSPGVRTRMTWLYSQNPIAAPSSTALTEAVEVQLERT